MPVVQAVGNAVGAQSGELGQRILDRQTEFVTQALEVGVSVNDAVALRAVKRLATQQVLKEAL